MVKPLFLACDGDREKTKRRRQDDLEDWATKLVTQQSDVVTTASTKSERIEKRLSKKKRNDEIKQKVPARSKNIKSSTIAASNFDEDQIVAGPVRKKSNNIATGSVADRMCLSQSPDHSRIQLAEFSKQLERCLVMIKERRKSWQKPYVPVPVIANNTSKRRRLQQANNMEDWFQPRRSNYGGIGFARPSLIIELNDPSWQAKLEEEFLEHVPGFYGKQRTKAMKKQLDGQMLWRQLQQQKLKGPTTALLPKKPNQIAISGKKLSGLNPDERVEAMIRAGYI